MSNKSNRGSFIIESNTNVPAGTLYSMNSVDNDDKGSRGQAPVTATSKATWNSWENQESTNNNTMQNNILSSNNNAHLSEFSSSILGGAESPSPFKSNNINLNSADTDGGSILDKVPLMSCSSIESETYQQIIDDIILPRSSSKSTHASMHNSPSHRTTMQQMADATGNESIFFPNTTSLTSTTNNNSTMLPRKNQPRHDGDMSLTEINVCLKNLAISSTSNGSNTNNSNNNHINILNNNTISNMNNTSTMKYTPSIHINTAIDNENDDDPFAANIATVNNAINTNHINLSSRPLYTSPTSTIATAVTRNNMTRTPTNNTTFHDDDEEDEELHMSHINNNSSTKSFTSPATLRRNLNIIIQEQQQQLFNSSNNNTNNNPSHQYNYSTQNTQNASLYSEVDHMYMTAGNNSEINSHPSRSRVMSGSIFNSDMTDREDNDIDPNDSSSMSNSMNNGTTTGTICGSSVTGFSHKSLLSNANGTATSGTAASGYHTNQQTPSSLGGGRLSNDFMEYGSTNSNNNNNSNNANVNTVSANNNNGNNNSNGNGNGNGNMNRSTPNSNYYPTTAAASQYRADGADKEYDDTITNTTTHSNNSNTKSSGSVFGQSLTSQKAFLLPSSSSSSSSSSLLPPPLSSMHSNNDNHHYHHHHQNNAIATHINNYYYDTTTNPPPILPSPSSATGSTGCSDMRGAADGSGMSGTGNINSSYYPSQSQSQEYPPPHHHHYHSNLSSSLHPHYNHLNNNANHPLRDGGSNNNTNNHYPHHQLNSGNSYTNDYIDIDNSNIDGYSASHSNGHYGMNNNQQQQQQQPLLRLPPPAHMNMNANHNNNTLTTTTNNKNNNNTTVTGTNSAAANIENLSPIVSGFDGFVYKVQFKRTHRNFLRSAGVDRAIQNGDFVIVEADRGEDLGVVCEIQPMPLFFREGGSLFAKDTKVSAWGDRRTGVKHIIRHALPQEYSLLPVKIAEESSIVEVCRDQCRVYLLPMLVVDAEYQYDRHKLTIFYESNSRRIDFRELVRDLFAIYKTRIWMEAVSYSFKPSDGATRALVTGVQTLPGSTPSNYMMMNGNNSSNGSGGSITNGENNVIYLPMGGGNGSNNNNNGYITNNAYNNYDENPAAAAGGGGGGGVIVVEENMIMSGGAGGVMSGVPPHLFTAPSAAGSLRSTPPGTGGGGGGYEEYYNTAHTNSNSSMNNSNMNDNNNSNNNTLNHKPLLSLSSQQQQYNNNNNNNMRSRYATATNTTIPNMPMTTTSNNYPYPQPPLAATGVYDRMNNTRSFPATKHAYISGTNMSGNECYSYGAASTTAIDGDHNDYYNQSNHNSSNVNQYANKY